MRSSLIPALFSLALYLSGALSFSVTVGSAPTQCGSLNITWTGGQAPFKIMVTPAFDVPMTVDVPSSAFTNNKGVYQISPFPFYNQTRFVVTMSDATGFGTGGTSNLFTVGLPVGSASCGIYSPTLAYTFSLPSSLQQCSPYAFTQYDGAALPVTVTGLIPSGNSFTVQSPSSGTNFSWTADVATGTTIIFTMTDAQGRSGGSSDTMNVAASNVNNCLNSASPSSTTNQSPSSTSPVTSPTSSNTSSTGVATSTIVGAAVGAGIGVAAIASLVVWYLNRRRRRGWQGGIVSKGHPHRPASLDMDPSTDNDNFHHPPVHPYPFHSDSASRLAPLLSPGLSSAPGSGFGSPYHDSTSTDPSARSSEPPYGQLLHSPSNSHGGGLVALGDVANSSVSASMSSSGRQKAAMAGMGSHYPPTRFIVHTDAEDEIPEVVPAVVELPPQYTERMPMTMQTASRPMSSATALSSSSLAYASGQGIDDIQLSTSHPPLH